MIIKNVRFSYLNVFEAVDSFKDGRYAYSVTILIPKSDVEGLKKVTDAIEAAAAAGEASGKFKKGASKLPTFKRPLRDGDLEREMNPDSRGDEYKGCMFFNARNTKPVGCVTSKLQPIRPEDQELYFSGWYGHVDVNFFAFNTNGSIGIAAGLNNIMFTHAGERLDGQQSAMAAFADLAEEDSENEDFE